MTQTKTSRAFRTISEAADELDLQSHVLRFWESKFSDIQPMKRRGGRRFYRPEDIEFLRGIKVLLHKEKHPIKDVQKLIRIQGAQSVRDLGRSVEKAAKPRAVKDTNLVPRRIKPVADKPIILSAKPEPIPEPIPEPDSDIVRRPGFDVAANEATPRPTPPKPEKPVVVRPAEVETPQLAPAASSENNADLEDALSRLKNLKSRWKKFT